MEAQRDHKMNKLYGYSERYIKVLFDGPDMVKNTVVSVQIDELIHSLATGTLQ